jgi:beta-glucosidase
VSDLASVGRRREAFPAGFVWGAATSAYQIEGNPRADGKGESIWDRFTHLPGRIADGATGDIACDHYRRSREDVAIMAALGLDAYRFSIAWTRILPAGTGAVNEAGLDFYDRLVDDLLAAGIEPWITLYHWDLPQALEDLGGWPRRETAAAFASYADVVTRRLGDRVRRWITVNEPWEVGFLGYQQGVHAPGRTSLADGLAAIHTVLLAHGAAVPVIRANSPGARVGLAVDLVACYPERSDPADAAAARRLDGHFNRWFLDPLAGRTYPADTVTAYGPAAPDVQPGDIDRIATPVDFFGLNYYYSHWVRAGSGPSEIERLLGVEIAPPHTAEVTGLGWAVHPAGLTDSLLRIAALDPSWDILVTEAGAAYEDRAAHDGRVEDIERLRYHAAYLAAVRTAIADGAPVSGYFAWSLFDNFEWSEGYGPRFGIVRVEYETQRRTIKASGEWYRRTIAANALQEAEPADRRVPG